MSASRLVLPSAKGARTLGGLVAAARPRRPESVCQQMKQRTRGRSGQKCRRGLEVVAAAQAASWSPRPLECMTQHDKQHTARQRPVQSRQWRCTYDSTMDTLDVEKFILEIEKRSPIWDMTSEEYHKRELKKTCWEEIVLCFGGRELDVKGKNELGEYRK